MAIGRSAATLAVLALGRSVLVLGGNHDDTTSCVVDNQASNYCIQDQYSANNGGDANDLECTTGAGLSVSD